MRSKFAPFAAAPLWIAWSACTTATAADLISIGDSVTAGSAASDSPRPGRTPRQDTRRQSLGNLAYGSGGIADYAYQAYPGYSNVVFHTTSVDPVPPGMQTAILAGYNDMRDFGTNAAFLEHFERTLSAVVGRVALPEYGETARIQRPCPQDGDWQLIPQYTGAGGAIGVQSQSVGAQLEFELTGSMLWLVCMARAQPATPFMPGRSGLPFHGGGTLRLAIDGKDFGELSCFSAFGNRTAVNGFDAFIPVPLDYAPHLYRVTGLASATHSVQLTVVSNATQAGFLWGAGSAAMGSRSDLPRVWVGGTLRMPADGYAQHSVRGSDTAVDAFDAIIRGVCNDWFRAGASVGWVDVDGFYDPSIHVSPDRIHPTDAGHAAIAEAFLSQWERLRAVGRSDHQTRLELLAEPGRFEVIERSADLHTWTEFLQLKPSIPLTAFTDESTEDSVHFYRLRQP